MAADLPDGPVGVHGVEVLAQGGVLHGDAVPVGVPVDEVQQKVHVGELHRSVVKRPVTSLRATRTASWPESRAGLS